MFLRKLLVIVVPLVLCGLCVMPYVPLKSLNWDTDIYS